MRVVFIHDNISLNYNPFLSREDPLIPTMLPLYIMVFFFGRDRCFYLFVAAPNNVFRLPTYLWLGSNQILVLKVEV